MKSKRREETISQKYLYCVVLGRVLSALHTSLGFGGASNWGHPPLLAANTGFGLKTNAMYCSKGLVITISKLMVYLEIVAMLRLKLKQKNLKFMN